MKGPAHATPGAGASESGGVGAILLAALGAGAWLVAVAMLGPGKPAILFAPAALVLATAGALVCGAAAMGWPRAIAALVVLIAFGLSIAFRTREAGDTGLDLQNGIKLLVWLLLPMIALGNARRILFFFRDPLVAMTGLYVLAALASGLWSPAPAYTAASALGLAGYLLLACVAVAALGQAALLRLLVLTLTVYAAMTLATSMLLPGTAWMALADGNPVLRLQGLSGHPNVLGEQMAVLITLTAIARREQLIGRPLFLLGIAAGFAILLATESRTTLLAVLASWGLVAARQRGLLVPVLVTGALVAGAAVLAGALGRDPLPEELLAAFSRSGSASELGTLTGRTDLWEVSAVLIGERPLLGWGFNGTEELLVASVGRGFIGDPVNAHNMYVQSVLSLGFVGSLPFFAVLAVLVGRMIVVPDPARDQFVLLVLVIGLAEVALCATPTLLTLVFFVVLACEALNGPSPAARRPPPVREIVP